MTPRPRILDELGRELARATRAAEARSRGGALARVPRTLVIGLLTLLGVAAAAAAASLIVGHGDPIPAARAGDVPAELRPVAGSARLNGLNVPDPDGGPAWDVRTSRSRTGAVCATVGQVLDGELGLLGLDRRFRALPAGAADTCSTPQRSGATLAGARAFRGGGRLSALTVVNGVAAPGVRRAIAVAGGRSVAMRLGPGRAFVAVFRGLPEEVRPRVVLTEATGRRTTLRFADSGEFIAADPSGGSPWALVYPKAAPGLRCVAARRERGPETPAPTSLALFNVVPPSVPPRCGRATRAFVAIRRFVPRAQTIGRAFWWGLNPARTIVWGVAPRGTGEVLLGGAGGPRSVRVDGRGGGFLAVLDGRVDPRALHVSAGGRTLRSVAVGTKGQALADTPVPAWRSVASAARGSTMPGDPFEADRGSVAVALRAGDPTGGPAWALRAWTAKVDPHAVADEHELVCFAIGVERGSKLVEPRAGGTSRVVGTTSRDGRCNGARWLRDHAGGAEVRTYVDDPDVPDPRPVRVVVAGLLGDGVRSAQLLGAGAPRALDLGRHGAFLLVLGPEHAGAELRVRQVRAGGVLTSAATDLGIDCRPLAGRSARVADPGGAQSWTAGVGKVVGSFGRRGRIAGGDTCQYLGRLAGGRLAFVIDGETWMRYGAYGFSSLPAAFGGRIRRVLTVTLQGPGSAPQRETPPPASAAGVARRTLPGRTLLYGTARSDVTSITLRTPRDVRTVRPGPAGVFIAVYDGPFYGGTVLAIARLRNGRTVTKNVQVGPY